MSDSSSRIPDTVELDEDKKKLLDKIRNRNSYGEVGDMLEKQATSRRDFLQSLGLVSGGLALGAMGFKAFRSMEEKNELENRNPIDESVTGMSTHATDDTDTETTSDAGDSTGSEYTAQEHEIEISSSSGASTNYYFKVAGQTTTTSSTEDTSEETGSTATVTTNYQNIEPGASDVDELRGIGLYEHAPEVVKENTDWFDKDGDGKVTISDINSHIGEAFTEKLFDVESRPGSKASEDHLNLKEFVDGYSGSNSDAIQEAFNNNKKVYIPEGTIEYNDRIWVSNTNELLVYGPGTLKTTGGIEDGEHMLRFQTVDNLALYGFKLEGHGAVSGKKYGGLYTQGGNNEAGENLEIRNLEISNVSDLDQNQPHSLAVSGYLKADVVGNYVHDTAGKGLSLRVVEAEIEKQRVVGNHMKNTGEDGIQPGTNTENDYRQVLVAGNRVDTTRNNYGIRIGGGPGSDQIESSSGYCVNCICFKNTYIDGDGANIEVKGQDVEYQIILENKLVGNSLNIRSLGNPSGGLLAGNTIEESSQNEGVKLISDPANVIVRNNSYPGLVVDGGSDFWIYDNENYNDFENIDSSVSNLNRSPR